MLIVFNTVLSMYELNDIIYNDVYSFSTWAPEVCKTNL